MIIGSNEQDVMFGNAPSKRTGFKIQAGRKAFQVLSEKLYKDKAEAVLRELSCNAVDIHCELGKGHIPFNVTLPTSIYPWFVIRDFGTGLTQEQVDEIFTVYFASTKDGSDDSIGGFGLGCKSPFAYSESGGGFTVKSYQKGMCTVYNMYMDNGEPFATPMSTTPTTEEDGLEILVPIPEHEHARWKVLARKVYRAFDRCKPYITNMDASSIEEFPNQDSFFYTDDFSRSGEVYAVIGGVVYPIPQRLLESDMVFRYAGKAAYIKCPIGSVDIAPSREELSLTKEGEDYIVSRLRDFSDNFAESVKKEFDGITDKRKAVIKASGYNNYVRQAIADLIIDGERINDLIDRYTNMSKLCDITVYAYRGGSLRQRITRSGYSWRSSNIDATEVFGISRRKVHVLINDTGEGIPNMVRAYHHHIGNTIPVVVMNKTRKLKKNEYAQYARTMKAICEKFDVGERSILKFSEMDDIRKAFTVHKRKTSPRRDPKPNVQRHYVNDFDIRDVELVYMTSAEIKALEGIAVISYNDTFDRIALKASLYTVRNAPSKLMQIGATEVYVIDNGKRSAAVKAPGLKCGFKWAYDQCKVSKDAFDILSAECPNISDYEEAIRLKQMGILGIDITEKFDESNDDFLNDASQWVEIGNPDYADFAEIKEYVDEQNKKYSEMFYDCMESLKIKHPLLFAVAVSGIELTPEIMKDIEILRAQ